MQVELREVVLRNKPKSMLDISPKGTVPVLQFKDGTVIDESWDIVHWATSQRDPIGMRGNIERVTQANLLIEQNDNVFKQHLDHYKYADRFPDFPASHYRTQAETFLLTLEERLAKHAFLLDENPSLADIGIFPFVRQFAHVDIGWFRQTPYPKLHAWFDYYLASELFLSIMPKFKAWSRGDEVLIF